MAGMERFESYYRDSRPPWEIGRPQPEVVRLAAEGRFRGRVLDAGCGTGENTLHLAGLGYDVCGIDGSPTAIERARAKLQARGARLAAGGGAEAAVPTFQVGDALALATLGRRFDTILDCGLFHVFEDAERVLYVRSLASVLEPGGTLLLLCFSEHEPGGYGPRRVTQAEIRAAFAAGWRVEAIREARFEHNREEGFARGWLAIVTRL
jgi:SAM-dependent methyltransferase